MSAAASRTRPARPRSLLCPQCGAAIQLRASGSSVTALCPACATMLDVTNPEVRIIAAADAQTRTPTLPIGARGRLESTEWQIVGYQVRSTEAGSWSWEEYLLFNPFQGFRFLAQDHGNWTLFRLLRDDFGGGDPPGHTQQEQGTATTDYVLGEFYWRVRTGDTVEFREFEDGAAVLTEERSATETTWSAGNRVAEREVRSAFGLPLPLPPPLVSPGTYGRLVVGALAAVALLALHLLPWAAGNDRPVFRQDFTAAPGIGPNPVPPVLVSPDFDLPGRGGSLTVAVASTQSDTGVGATVKLLPASGGQGYTLDAQVGGYFGTGLADGVVTFSAVPDGRYRVSVALDGNGLASAATGGIPLPAPSAPPLTLTVLLTRHVASRTNLIVALLLVLAWPLVSLLRDLFLSRPAEH